MKSILIIFAIIIFSITLRSQEIGWYGQDQTSGHMVTLHIGADYGTVYGVSYGYKFSGKIPLVLGTELTTPFGGQIMDDFKAKLTAQTIFYPAHHLGIAIKPAMNFRRYGSAAAVICNISSELGTSIGYYRDTWSIAAKASYDHTNATLIKHRNLKEYYPEIRDEWYGSTGGNFKFGMQGNYWFKTTGISFEAGKTFGQNFTDNPTIPYYADFSVMKKW